VRFDIVRGTKQFVDITLTVANMDTSLGITQERGRDAQPLAHSQGKASGTFTGDLSQSHHIDHFLHSPPGESIRLCQGEEMVVGGAAGVDRPRLEDRFVQTVAGRPTTSKTRIIARSQQIVRIDDEVETLLDGHDLERLTRVARDALADADALLLEDYNKGALPPALIAAVMEVARRRGIPIVVDPKFRQFFEYAGATVFKPNRRELESALGAAVDLQNGNALPEVLARLKVDNLLVTLGAEGMVLVMKDGSTTHFPSIARDIYDVSGAGDTVTAWMGTALAACASVRESAQLANYAAGVEVGKAGVATVSPEEVLAVYEERFDQIGRLRRGGLI